MANWRAISALPMMTTVCGALSAAIFEREADTTTACIWPSVPLPSTASCAMADGAARAAIRAAYRG